MSMKAENKNPTKPADVPRIATHMARLVGIVDLGHQPSWVYQGKEIPSVWKYEFIYELPKSLMEDGRPHWVSEEVKNNDFEGKGLQSTLMARIRTLAEDPEEAREDLTLLLNGPCMVTLSPGNRDYPKIKGQSAVSGVPIGMDIPELVNEPFTFDMDNPDLEVFYKLREFTRDKIMNALNYPGSALERELSREAEY